MNSFSFQLKNGIRRIYLRDKKSWRIQQIRRVDGKLAADRRFDSETESDGVRPARAQILLKNIVGGGSVVGLAENIADFSENIAAVIKRHEA